MQLDDNPHKQCGALDSEAFRAVFEAQCILLKKLVSTTRPPYERDAIKTLLNEANEIALNLTAAEHGSLILFDSDGQVADSLISRRDIPPDKRLDIVAQVLEEGLAGWVVRHHDIGVVADTSTDARWLVLPDQPYTTGSALCLPIISAEMLLGVLTLAHSAPGHFSPKITEMMRLLTNQMALIIENANLFANLSDSFDALGTAQKDCDIYARSLASEFNKCRKIQMDFLPKDMPMVDGWEVEGFFFPANRVSGDFYDAFRLPGGYVGLVIGDVCDKGVGAALFMALFRSLIRIFSGQAQLKRNLVNRAKHTVGGTGEASPRRRYSQVEAIRAVALVNDYIAREHGEMSMFATLFFGILEPESGRMVYINGGHEPLFLLDGNGIKNYLSPTGPAVGVFPQVEFTYKELRFRPGDMIFGFTDGVIDAQSEKGERFTKERLTSLVDKPASSVLEVMGNVGTELFAHIGKAPQADDITMLALRRREGS